MGSLRIICFSAMWVDCALTRSPEQLKIGISTYFDIQYKHERDSSWAKNSYETRKKLSSLSRGLENHPTPIKYSFISLKIQGDIPFHFFTKRKGGTTHIYWRQTGFLSYSESRCFPLRVVLRCSTKTGSFWVTQIRAILRKKIISFCTKIQHRRTAVY